MSEKALELNQSRFLAFVVLAATGFLGEVQLASFDHSSVELSSRAILTISAVVAGMLGVWGALASAASFTEATLSDRPGEFTGDPTSNYPWAASIGARLQRSMEAQIRVSVRQRVRVTFLDLIVGLFLVTLVLLLVWAVL